MRAIFCNRIQPGNTADAVVAAWLVPSFGDKLRSWVLPGLAPACAHSPSAEACWPGVARRQLTFLLLRQKKSKQKKRRPYLLRPLRFATGQPAVLEPSGVWLNSLRCASLRQRQP